MQAKPGDQILIHGRKVGDTDRTGVIIDVRGTDGTPPYIVRWGEDESEHLIFPGSDAVVTSGRKPAKKAARKASAKKAAAKKTSAKKVAAKKASAKKAGAKR